MTNYPKTKIEQAQEYIKCNIGASNRELERKTGISEKTYREARKRMGVNFKPFKEVINTSAKVLILDIETAPILSFVWDVWNQNVQPAQIVKDWFCLTWAAKWLFENKVYSAGLTSDEAIRQDDKRIMQAMWQMVNEADIVIAHNGGRFDLPRLNTRFLIHRMNPPAPYQLIDTLTHIRKQFAFPHNKLDYVNQVLGLTRKKENEGWPLWKKCYAGEKVALKEMLEYNQQDVFILEEHYLRIRAWIKPHPNMGLFILDKVSRCPSCGSKDIKFEGKYYYTTVNRFEAFRCENCGSAGRLRKSDIEVTKRRHITSSIPK